MKTHKYRDKQIKQQYTLTRTTEELKIER